MDEMDIFLEFMLWFLAAEAVLTLLQLPERKRRAVLFGRMLRILLKFLAATVLALLVMAGPVQLRIAQPFMLALYAALMADAAADALYSLVRALRKRERRSGGVRALSLVFGILFLLFGAANMEIVTPEYHTYTSEKLTQEHTVVFIADLHVGSAQPFRVTEKTIREAQTLSPDCIILGGDVVDDYTTKEEMEDTFRLFAGYGSPVYFIYGNHDRQGHAEYAGGRKFTPEELESALTANGIIALKDEFSQIAPDLLLLGREDLSEGDSRADIAALTDPSPDSYLITADHQPTAFSDNCRIGTDLQLSGHTHAGQLFPLRAVYSLFTFPCGDYEENGAVMNVSAGACGWRMPIRTEARCCYEVITLRPSGSD